MEERFLKRSFRITVNDGLHARPCTWLVSSASSFQSDVQLTYNERTVNLKSIMGLMSLAVTEGATITISVEGEDEETCIDHLTEVMVSKGLGEECSS